jgi:hypothetical protein
MSQTVAARINELDDKQAIFQVKLLLQSAMDSTPDLMALDDAAIAAKLKAINSDAPDTLAEAAAIMTTGSTVPLPTKEAGSAAKEMLRVFAATPDGGEILDASLNLKDESGDFGLITFPLVCTFLWLAVAGDFDLELGRFRYRKKGLTSDQQAKLVKPLLPTGLKALIKAAFNPLKP